jgi:hypothetical protein
MLKYLWRIDITMIASQGSPVDLDMEIEMAGKKRETLIDPMYKRIDKMGRVYVDRNLAEQEVLIVVIKPKPEDKINYIKVGRGTWTFESTDLANLIYKNKNIQVWFDARLAGIRWVHLHQAIWRSSRWIIMENELSKDSVKRLLNHWIEHNESHSASFRERAGQIAKVSELAAQDVNQAAQLMDQCTEMLRKAMKDL